MSIEYRLGTPASDMIYRSKRRLCAVCGSVFNTESIFFYPKTTCADCQAWAYMIEIECSPAGALEVLTNV